MNYKITFTIKAYKGIERIEKSGNKKIHTFLTQFLLSLIA